MIRPERTVYMNVLIKINNWIEKICEAISGLMVIAIMAIICLQVVVRNFFSFNIGTLADYPVYMMTYAVWIGAIVAAKNDDHLCIDLVSVITKKESIQQAVKIIMDIITAVAFGVFAFYAFKQLGVLHKRGQIESATKIPMWILQSIMPISATFQSFYYALNAAIRVKGRMSK